MGFIDKIRQCNYFNDSNFIDFIVEDKRVGHISKKHKSLLLEHRSVFQHTDNSITLNADLNTYEKRTNIIGNIIIEQQKKKLIPEWGNESYPVSHSFYHPPYFSIPRCAAAFFGIKTYGTHLNGYTVKDGKIFVWVARRAAHLKFLAGKLDNLAAGGLPVGLSPSKNMSNEAYEEANLAPEITRKIRPVSAVSYLLEANDCALPDTMFVYDLELSPDIIPTPNKEEVDEFVLYSIDELYEVVKNTDSFKYNSALVMIDFLVRHSAITPEEEHYLEITQQLRQ